MSNKRGLPSYPMNPPQYTSIIKPMEPVISFKSKVNEWCQKNNFSPVFNHSSTGPPHNPKWSSAVTVNGFVGKGIGRSRSEAENKACEDVWNFIVLAGTPPPKTNLIRRVTFDELLFIIQSGVDVIRIVDLENIGVVPLPHPDELRLIVVSDHSPYVRKVSNEIDKSELNTDGVVYAYVIRSGEKDASDVAICMICGMVYAVSNHTKVYIHTADKFALSISAVDRNVEILRDYVKD